MKQSEINKRAKKLAEHANSSLGRIPLERVFEKHISFLEELRQFGATWAQIAQLLFTHGITQKSGNILHPNQVRGTFVRALKKSKVKSKTVATAHVPRIHDTIDTTAPKPPLDAPRMIKQQAQIPSSADSKFIDLRRTMSQASKARNIKES